MNDFRNLTTAVIAGLIVIGIGAAIDRWRDPLLHYAPYVLLSIFGFGAVVTASALGTIIAFRLMRQRVG